MFIRLFREKPKVISENTCWVIIHEDYMYTDENLLRLIYQFIFEHKHDKHLVG